MLVPDERRHRGPRARRILLNEALRSFKPDITPEQATTDVVTGRVARAAAALYALMNLKFVLINCSMTNKKD